MSSVQVSLATFATYALINRDNPDERLTADKVFVALSLFNIIRFPLSLLPMLITFVVQVSHAHSGASAKAVFKVFALHACTYV